MAFEEVVSSITLEAGSTAIRQFRFVSVSSTRERACVLPSTGASAVGVALTGSTDTAVGDPITVQISGVAKVQAAASTVAFGDRIGTNGAGRAIALAAGDASLGQVVGGSSGGLDRVFSVLLNNAGSTEALR
jgi:hypothetical protein